MNLSILPNLVVVVNLVILGVSCDSREFDDICEYDDCVDYGEADFKFCAAADDFNLSFLGKGRGRFALTIAYLNICVCVCDTGADFL